MLRFLTVSCTSIIFVLSLQEDDTGFFDSCESGTPEEYPPNSGYRERKKLFAKEVAVKDPSTQEVTG